jgi:hypothetical protein
VIFGTTTFSVVHVAISLMGIGCGFVVLLGMLRGKSLVGWTGAFLAATIATSATGFGFPFIRLLPSHIVGAVSLVVLALAVYARYARHLGGGWRSAYVVSAVVALYLNVFVLIVQLFAKLPALMAMAPTQSEPPFLIAQLAALALFVALGVIAVRKFRPDISRAPRQVWNLAAEEAGPPATKV